MTEQNDEMTNILNNLCDLLKATLPLAEGIAAT